MLGDMLELGQYEEDGHQRVGIRAAQVADEIILVGQRSLQTQAAALESGFPAERVHWFPDQSSAAHYLQQTLKEKDIALIKGSHAMRMDLIVSNLEVIS